MVTRDCGLQVDSKTRIGLRASGARVVEAGSSAIEWIIDDKSEQLGAVRQSEAEARRHVVFVGSEKIKHSVNALTSSPWGYLRDFGLQLAEDPSVSVHAGEL